MITDLKNGVAFSDRVEFTIEDEEGLLMKKYSVWILWGEDPQEDQRMPLQYEFNTQARC